MWIYPPTKWSPHNTPEDALRATRGRSYGEITSTHGSIAVTERVILTLKYEWLERVPVIRGLDHLKQLLQDFEIYYNEYRGHKTLGGAAPSLIHRGGKWTKPEKSAKTLPPNVERRFFPNTQITTYRLAA